MGWHAANRVCRREIRTFLALLHTENGIYYHNLVEALSSICIAQSILAEWKAAAFPSPLGSDRSLTLGGATSKMAKSLLKAGGLTAAPAYLMFWIDLSKHYQAKVHLTFNKLAYVGQKTATELTDMYDALPPYETGALSATDPNLYLIVDNLSLGM